ncbi:MAG: MotA/TolQ/ExbB proton channel family protein [Planctomycetota bacterium]|nr:MAG: MotA/TolQ/ExbB proton channel family protein [Planctomycetota bacterium]REJ90812.1 MAG: MotA/TolQ/ExbB proton channel family protein [Planctomycetota bacterium]REK24284.1 MAG: MotA/TolQ/ExbB proton channel family protein [Planctomycetota bacterium]REK28731.1 MAG: MotA/TolQ/ExbB proton channel family protein [Planctomycetota bacterium]
MLISVAPLRVHRLLLLVISAALVATALPSFGQTGGADEDAGVVPEFAEDPTPLNLPTSIVEMFRALDIWTAPFLALTLVAVWFTTERLVVLRRGRVIPKPFVKRFLKLLDEGELEPGEAVEICEDNDSPVARVFLHGVRKWGKPSVEVEQAIIDGGERQVSSLRKNLRVINGVATVSPLLGLLGTVWGMLGAFQDISTAGAAGNMQQLGSNIALALVTTAAGLVIAIPSLIIYMYLSGRVDALVMEMDDLSQNVVQCVSSEALAERASRPRRVPKPPAASDDEPRKKKAV